jgi:glycosyltransferase involved in cell wall biosynthesis
MVLTVPTFGLTNTRNIFYSSSDALGFHKKIYMKIPPSPLYQRGVRGDFHTSLCPCGHGSYYIGIGDRFNFKNGGLMMTSNHRPAISVIIPSLNHAKYLRETIESILSQTFRNFECIVVDGGSTDGTIDILKEYPSIRWISEKETDENIMLEAYRKAFAMSRGDYIVQCAVTDGFLAKKWFEMCSDKLDQDIEVSLVWGLAQHMTEDGYLGRVVNQEFLWQSPPQKQAFLAYWLSYGPGFPEGNFCMRRNIFDECLPQRNQPAMLNEGIYIELMYKFNTRGYLSYFLPTVANFGRTHANQKGVSRGEALNRDVQSYNSMVKIYRKQLLNGNRKHCFRDGLSKMIGEVKSEELGKLRKQIFIHYVKYKVNKRLMEMQERLWAKRSF